MGQVGSSVKRMCSLTYTHIYMHAYTQQIFHTNPPCLAPIVERIIRHVGGYVKGIEMEGWRNGGMLVCCTMNYN